MKYTGIVVALLFVVVNIIGKLLQEKAKREQQEREARMRAQRTAGSGAAGQGPVDPARGAAQEVAAARRQAQLDELRRRREATAGRAKSPKVVVRSEPLPAPTREVPRSAPTQTKPIPPQPAPIPAPRRVLVPKTPPARVPDRVSVPQAASAPTTVKPSTKRQVTRARSSRQQGASRGPVVALDRSAPVAARMNATSVDATPMIALLRARGRSSLREAVVFSEILGPPVALRD